jgi:hypothetical protein
MVIGIGPERVTGIGSEQVIGIRSESVIAFIGITRVRLRGIFRSYSIGRRVLAIKSIAHRYDTKESGQQERLIAGSCSAQPVRKPQKPL